MLEDTLGVKLVERDRQRVLMTPIGLEIARRARSILSAAQDLVDAAAGAGKPMAGLLRLGVIPTVAPFLLPRLVAALRERYPEVHLALREDLTQRLLARIEDGRLDFALIALPHETANLLVQPLFDDALWLVGRKGDPEVKRKVATVTPAIAERLLLLEEGHCLREHALYACGTPPRRAAERLEATSLLTLVQMIASGLGVGLVPEMAVRSGLTQIPGLIARPMSEPGPKRTIALIARRSTPRLADYKALADATREINVSGAVRTHGRVSPTPRSSLHGDNRQTGASS